MSRWLSVLPLVAMALLAALFGLFALHHNPHIEPHAMVGKPMPDLTLPSLDDGQQHRLAAAAAEGPVLVNFFASWCGPCETEQPTLLAMKAHKARIIGIAYKDAPENTQGFLSRLGDPFEARLVDRDGRAGIEFGVTGVPETYLVAKGGKIISKHTGPLSPADAETLTAQAQP